VGVSTWGQTLGGASPKQRGQEGCGPEAFLSVENCCPCLRCVCHDSLSTHYCSDGNTKSWVGVHL
jgi:hypothetical protein